MDGFGKEIAGRSSKMTNEMESHKKKRQHTIFWTPVPVAGDALKCQLHALVPRQGRYWIDLCFCDGCGICYEICPIGAVTKEAERISSEKMNGSRAGS